MAVDLARPSLWLATLARDHEFTFLDHALKPGDSLVGLDLNQIEALHWDPPKSDPQLSLTRLLVRDRLGKVEAERRRIREAVEDASENDLRPILNRAQVQLGDPKLMGDAVIAAFFTGAKVKEREAARAEVQAAVEMGGPGWCERLAPLTAGLTVTPFHWPLEFPEVFARAKAGFDAIVGNPPFAGKNTLIASHPKHYPDWLQTLHAGAHGNSDLVAHFFRRGFHLLRQRGALGLIATNTIRQGDTGATGLGPIRAAGGVIYHAERRIKWPGEAAVVIATVHVDKGALEGPYILNDRPVERITAFLFHAGPDTDPAKLAGNANTSFVGSFVLGMGFTFDDHNLAKGSTPITEMHRLVERDPRNAERIFPYINGGETNERPTHNPTRYVINFEDFPLRRNPNSRHPWHLLTDEARSRMLRIGIVSADYPGPVASDWPELLALVQERAKPERDRQNRKALRERWWQYAEKRPGLYRSIVPLKRVLVRALTSSHFPTFTFLPKGLVYDQTLLVFTFEKCAPWGCLVSRAHEVWGLFLGATMKDDPRYNPVDCFETFPFPPGFERDPTLEAAGEAYYVSS